MKTEILFHEIEYYYEGYPEMELPESEEEYIQESIIKGYREGELNYANNDSDTEYYGWWRIIFK